MKRSHLVSAALNRHKRFPFGIALSGSPTLRVAIAASGQVTGATVVASSGSPELDDAAIQTVRPPLSRKRWSRPLLRRASGRSPWPVE